MGRIGKAYAFLYTVVKHDGKHVDPILSDTLHNLEAFITAAGYEPWRPGAAHLRKIKPKGIAQCPEQVVPSLSSLGSASPGSVASSVGSGVINPIDDPEHPRSHE